MTGIYKITNLVNGKVYIGQSVNIEKRFINHKSSAYNPKNKSYDYPLPRAIRKYGFENFQFEILEECSIDELNDKERWYITQYHAHGPEGYNQDDGGDQSSHYNKLSDDLISAIIAKLKTSLDNSDDIGDEFGVSGRTIRSINSGESCRRDNEVYPIRPPLWTLEDTINTTYKVKADEHNCKVCGAKTYVKNCLCVDCAHKAQRRVERPEALQLAQMIKNSGFSDTGRKFGVSDNTIKKWCKAYGIPYLKNELIQWYNEQISV